MTRAEYLLRPLVIAGVILWIANDHVLKAAYPSWWTGKLSDVASLAVFPLVPYAAIDLWRARRGLPPPSVATLLFWIVATGLVMATINTIALAADAYRWGLGFAQWPFRALHTWSLVPILPVHLTEDPTDLLTLPALFVPWYVVRSASGPFDLRENPNRISGADRGHLRAGTSYRLLTTICAKRWRHESAVDACTCVYRHT